MDLLVSLTPQHYLYIYYQFFIGDDFVLSVIFIQLALKTDSEKKLKNW